MCTCRSMSTGARVAHTLPIWSSLNVHCGVLWKVRLGELNSFMWDKTPLWLQQCFYSCQDRCHLSLQSPTILSPGARHWSAGCHFPDAVGKSFLSYEVQMSCPSREVTSSLSYINLLHCSSKFMSKYTLWSESLPQSQGNIDGQRRVKVWERRRAGIAWFLQGLTGWCLAGLEENTVVPVSNCGEVKYGVHSVWAPTLKLMVWSC